MGRRSNNWNFDSCQQLSRSAIDCHNARFTEPSGVHSLDRHLKCSGPVETRSAPVLVQPTQHWKLDYDFQNIFQWQINTAASKYEINKQSNSIFLFYLKLVSSVCLDHYLSLSVLKSNTNINITMDYIWTIFNYNIIS